MEKTKAVNVYKCDIPMCNVIESIKLEVQFQFFLLTNYLKLLLKYYALFLLKTFIIFV
jgi:hypothetical protein